MPCCGKARQKFQNQVAAAKVDPNPTTVVTRAERIKLRQEKIRKRTERIAARQIRLTERALKNSN